MSVRSYALRAFAAWCIVGVALSWAQSAPSASLLSNGSFDLGRQFWELQKAGKTAAAWDINADDAPPAGRAALISIDKAESWGVQFGQIIEAGRKGKTYTFAMLARAVGSPATARLEIERNANPYDRAAQSEPVSLPADKWTEMHVTFKVEKDFSQGWFAYVSCAQSNVKFRVTGARLVEGDFVPFQQAQRDELAAAGVSLFDTGAASTSPLPADAFAKRAGWKQIPEDTTDHPFKGQAVLMNNRLALVVRKGAPGAELYSIEPSGAKLRSVIKPADAEPLEIAAVKTLENSPAGVSVEAAFKTSAGKSLTLGCELKMGQVFVQLNAGPGISAVRVEAPCRFALMPDFFADDIVVDARSLAPARAELPSENFLLQFVDDGNAIVMSVWNDRDDDVNVALSGRDADRRIDAADLPCAKSHKAWVAVLAREHVWHLRDISASDAGKIVPLDWKAPIPAMWRLNWRRDDGLADSWEMIVQRNDHQFMKYGLTGSAQSIPASRKRWTTVLGSFAYPCWIDSSGQAFAQPLKSGKVHWAGPALIYPLGRAPATPLDAFTVADIVRATLGVGPCEYILDLEGQQSQYKGRATCANRDTLNPIYEKHQQKEKKQEIEKSLSEVIVFIRHIRSRIQAYVDFGHEIRQYLVKQKQAHPELEKPLAELDALAAAIDARFEARRSEIKTPDEAAAMIEAFRRSGLEDYSPGAFDKCKKFTGSIVEIGGSQDELVGECRWAVKVLRQRAALAMAAEPRLAEVAREIRARSQKVLRNPAGHEGARH